MKVETLAVHAGGAPDPATGAVSPPIVLATTFERGPASEDLHGFSYIREDNPTQVRLEEALAAVEGGEAALAFASGMAAGTAYLQAQPVGAHVLFQDDLYYDFRNVAREFLPRWGMSASAVDMGDLAAVRAALRPETKLVWLETPSNPLMKVCDIAAVVEIAHARGALVLVDGTFAPPRSSGPSISGPMPSSTRPPSTWAATATCRAAPSSSRRRTSGTRARGTSARRWAAWPRPLPPGSCCAACGRSAAAWTATAQTPWPWRRPSTATLRSGPFITPASRPTPVTRWPVDR